MQLARCGTIAAASSAALPATRPTAAHTAQHTNLVAPAHCIQLHNCALLQYTARRAAVTIGSSWQQQQRRHAAASIRVQAQPDTLASQDDPPTSPMRSLDDEQEAIESIQQLEVAEPVVEERAEGAAFTVIAALAFGAGIWAVMGEQKGAEYFAGYLLEQSLSVDNLFVFILVFNYFKTPVEYQSKVLTFGIITAAVLRLVLIVAGVDIVERFEPVLLVFAGILLLSSFKLLTAKDEEDEEEDLSQNKIVQFCKSLMSFSDTYDGDKFFTVQNGVRVATPLLLVLMVVELSDVIFAVDSIPAVFGVTLDPFIVYTSNLFAILSLRGLYTFVSTFMKELRYLDKAVAVVLGFVGAKILADFAGYHMPTEASLGVVAGILGLGVGASLLHGGNVEEAD